MRHRKRIGETGERARQRPDRSPRKPIIVQMQGSKQRTASTQAGSTATKKKCKKQIIIYMNKKSKTIIIYNLDKTVYGEFLSIVEAAKSLKCGEKTIRRALKGETKFLKRK